MNRLLRISKIVIPVWITLLFIADIIAVFYPRPIWVGREHDAFFIVDFILILLLLGTSLTVLIVKFQNKRKSGPIELPFHNEFESIIPIITFVLLVVSTVMVVDYFIHPNNSPSIQLSIVLLLLFNNDVISNQSGICKDGLIVSGVFYPWTRIAAYATLNDTIYLLIRRRKEGDPRLLERPVVSYGGEDIAGYLESRGIRRQPQPAGSYDNHKSDGV